MNLPLSSRRKTGFGVSLDLPAECREESPEHRQFAIPDSSGFSSAACPFAEITNAASLIFRAAAEVDSAFFALVALDAHGTGIDFLSRSPNWIVEGSGSAVYARLASILSSITQLGKELWFSVHQQPEPGLCGMALMMREGQAPIALVTWGHDREALQKIEQIYGRLRDTEGFQKYSRIGLTPRELQIIGLIAEGNTSCEIARLCGIADTTVNMHIANALNKTAAKNRMHLVALALRAGLLAANNLETRRV